jgi:tetratricopeptide (TPR) repeat protein
LRFYPKHLDTYRLLGKAFLESQRYTEAADILQRVLSAVPDDFISQIGMSLIREDEGNLDAAIFHMERAYEIQPANTAIRDELRRLYGRRDGVEPPKIRLTRGALVRMYARGDLYNQAIAEIRSALSEDPNRVDLEIILARMYYLNGKRVEAAEVCSRLVSKLPFCFEANRILAEVLPGTSRADDARVYQQRVTSLDPYQAHISPTSPSVAEVADQAVQVEHLEYDPNMEADSPEWAKTLGVAWSDATPEVPDWLNQGGGPAHPILGQPQTAPAEEAAAEEPASESTPSEAEPAIPDFMANAGWSVSEGEEQPLQALDLGEASTDEEIEPAEIPDWLRSMAPEDEAGQTEDQAAVAWLESILPGEAPQTPAVEPELEADTAAPEVEEPVEALETEIPDWLAGLALDEEEAEPGPVVTGETPEWLVEESLPSAALAEPVEEPAEEVTAAASDDIPDWLKEAQAAGDELPEIAVGEAEESPATFAEAAEGAPAEGLEETPNLEDFDAMAWLESLAARQGADEATLTTRPEERLDTPPDWIASLQTEGETLTAEPEAETEAAVEEPQFEAEIEAEPVEPQPEAIAEAEAAPAEAEPVTWKLEEPAVTPEVGDTQPLKRGVVAAQPEPEPVESEAAVEPTEAAAESDLSADDAFAWLESLAARQGADEETLLTAPQERQDAPPEWVANLVETTEAEVSLELAPVEAVAAEPETETVEPALFEAKSEPEGAVAIEEIEIEPVHPETLISAEAEPVEALEVSELEPEPVEAQAFEEIPAPEELPDVSVAPADTLAGEDDLLSGWMREVEELDTTPDEAAEEAPAEGVIPDWLRGLVEEETHAEPVSTPAVEPSAEWLQSLAEPPLEAEPPKAVEAIQPVPVMAEAGDGRSELELAQSEIQRGSVDSALERYTRMIQSGQHLEDAIHDLREALYRYPVDIGIWQALGDAYYANNQLQDALDAYTKAEELLR